MKIIAIHQISKQKINYKYEHYTEALKDVMKKQDDIEKIAIENLALLKGLDTYHE
jgi:hypothetical protein